MAQGGDITFDCGSNAVTIPISREIAVPMDASIDGGDQITLDGGGTTRISIVSGNTAGNPWNQGQNCTHTMPGSRNLQWPAPGS